MPETGLMIAGKHAMSERPEKILQEVGELPYMPKVVMEVIELLDDPEVTVNTIRDAVSTDPSLTAKIMIIANSTFYGRLVRRRNLTQAIITIGLKQLKPIVLGLSVPRMFRFFGPLERKAWQHSVSVSIASAVLARREGFEQWEDAMLCGLLHDIGKIILISANRRKYTETMRLASGELIELWQAENRAYGFTHMDVGKYASNHWGFPKVYQETISFHHYLDDQNETASSHTGVLPEDDLENALFYKLTAIVNLADHLCRALGFSMTERTKTYLLDYLPSARILGLDHQDIQGLLTTIGSEIKENRVLFE